MTTTASPKTLTDVLTSQQIDRLAFGLEEARELALSDPIDQLSSEVANSLGGVTGLQVVVKPGWVRGLIEDGKLYCSENRNRYEALGTLLRVFYWWFGGEVKISQVEVLLSAYDRVHKTKFVKNFQEVCA